MKSKLRAFHIISIVITLFTVNSNTRAEWDDATITAVTNTHMRKGMMLQSLDLDSNNYVHLVWSQLQEPDISHLYYSTNSPAGVWLQPEMVSDPTHTSGSPGLAVSPISDRPFIAFEQNSEIYYTHQSGTTWQVQQVTSNSQLDCSPSIAIDNTGTIHLAWITDDPASGEYEIAYAYGDTINWDIQTLTGGFLGPYGIGASPFIALSSQGVAHIVYRGGTYGNYHTHHAWNDTSGGSDWHFEAVLSGNIDDFSNCLVIDENDDLHLAVSGNDGWGLPGRVYYLYQPQGQYWESFELSSLSYSGTDPSLDVDIYGNPHIVWMETSGNFYTGRIFYSYKEETGNWQVSPVISSDYFFPSFKVDNQSFGHVGCHTGGNTGIYDIYHIQSAESLNPVKAFPCHGQESHSYILLRNEPNPCNSYTIIDYCVPAPAMVTMKAYNSLGKEVAVLVKKFQAAGNYQTKLDTGDLASGVYFYRIQAGSYIRTRQCVVLR